MNKQLNKTHLKLLVKTINNNYVCGGAKAVRYSEEGMRVQLFYTDKVVALYINKDCNYIGGWFAGDVTLTFANVFTRLVNQVTHDILGGSEND